MLELILAGKNNFSELDNFKRHYERSRSAIAFLTAFKLFVNDAVVFGDIQFDNPVITSSIDVDDYSEFLFKLTYTAITLKRRRGNSGHGYLTDRDGHFYRVVQDAFSDGE